MQTIASARWSCHGCGACCRDFRLGPVEPEVIAALAAAGASELVEPSGGRTASPDAWAVREPGPGGEEGWFLRHRDGACVFLLADNRCAVHARFGAEAKPGFCREFPFRRIADPNGEVLVIRAECAGFHASSVNGEPLADQIVAAARTPRLGPVPVFAPDAVAIVPGAGVDLANWMRLEGALLRRLEQVDATHREPEETARELASVAAGAIGRSLPGGRHDLAAAAVREAMRMVVNAAITQESEQTEEWQRPLVRDVRKILDADGPRRPLTGAARRYLHVLLGQALLGKQIMAVGSLAGLLGRFVFEVELVRRAPGEGPVDSGAASAVLVPWLRFAENPMVSGVLRRAAPALVELVSP